MLVPLFEEKGRVQDVLLLPWLQVGGLVLLPSLLVLFELQLWLKFAV